MDPNAVVLEISSDEDVDWIEHDGRGIADGGDDHDWLAELLDEVNKGNFGDDSDEVVVVGEVSPSEKPVKKSKLKSSLVDLDDDCVILDNDPDKPVEIRNDNPKKDEDDSDDIVVVSEKGQVACRDYPHSRHLCIKFPFSTTPDQSHCDQCYCYVCDSLAPCVYWGNGSATMDHCHATDKDEFWILERKNTKNGTNGVQPVPKVADVALYNGLHSHRSSLAPAPPPPQPMVQSHAQIPRRGSIYARLSANYQAPNNIFQNRRPVFPSKSKLHQNFLHQYSLARSGGRGHQGYSIPTARRTRSSVAATTANRPHPYLPHRGHSGNPNRLQSHPYSGSLQPNAFNTPVSYPPQSQTYTSPTLNPMIDQQWPLQPQFPNHSNLNVQSQVNSSPFHQPHLVPSSSRPERAARQPSYMAPAHPPAYPVPPPQTRVDSSAPISVSDYTQNLPDQGTQALDNGVSLPVGQHSATHEGSGPMNDTSSHVTAPGWLTDNRYDWIFDDQPVEPGFIEGGSGSYGLTDFSSDSSFIDTGPIFDF